VYCAKRFPPDALRGRRAVDNIIHQVKRRSIFEQKLNEFGNFDELKSEQNDLVSAVRVLAIYL
jgi:hypothetical protein